MKTDNTFESLLVNEQKELLRHAYALVGQREEAEELLQEVALRVLEKKDKFSLGTNFRGWVHRVMKSVFINMYRSKKSMLLTVNLWTVYFTMWTMGALE